MPVVKPIELSSIKLKTWTRQPAPMISEHSAHLTPLSVDFRTWLWRYTCLLLLISMLWHRQAIFKSKWDKLSSSAECRIRTLCHVRDKIKKRPTGVKHNKIYISTIKDNIYFYYIHAYNHKKHIAGGFIWYPISWQKSTCVFLLQFLLNKLLHGQPSGLPRLGSLIILPRLLITRFVSAQFALHFTHC